MSADHATGNTVGHATGNTVGHATGNTVGQATEPPVVRVERGNPTPEQLAALTVVLTAAGSGGGAGGGTARRQGRTLWTARSRFARPRPAVGPGGWRASALPR